MKKFWLCVPLALALLMSACTPAGDGQETSGDTSADTLSENVTSSDGAASEAETEGETGPVITFQNPLTETMAPDPYVIYHDGYYYATYTEIFGISLYRSKNIETLTTDERVIIKTPSDLVQGNVWAPELHYYPPTDRWYIYASASTNGFEFSAIRMFCLESTTSDPFGEYVFKGYMDPDLLAIDPSVFYDEESETLYTVYSEFTSDRGQVIMLAVMENPWTISDQRVRISLPVYSWESKGAVENKDSRVNEGPIFLKHNDKLCLIYSASGCWSQYYCLGLIEYTGENFSPEEMMTRANWKKHNAPVFSAANDVYGVGHCGFFNSPDGTETWIAYHGMPTPDSGENGRYLYVQKISFDENDLPVLGEPLSRDTLIPVPSGEQPRVPDETEAKTEPVTEAATSAATEAATEATTDATTEAATESVTDAATEAVTETVTVTVSETSAE